jgi:hypothetical protein
MSLFTTDAALLSDAPGEPRCDANDQRVTSHAIQRGSDVWRTLLPMLTTAALQRGHIRSAALAYEHALAQFEHTDSGIVATRTLLDAVSAGDARSQRRQLDGETVLIASQSATADGLPRFTIGLTVDELDLRDAQQFALDEAHQGAQPEVRNFLDDVLRDDDGMLDLDPGAGAALFTALTHPSAAITAHAWCVDRMQQNILRRNARAAQCCARVTLHDATFSTASIAALRPPSRYIVHLGRERTEILDDVLTVSAQRPLAVAWQRDTLHSSAVARTLRQAGMDSFALAVRDGESELVPLERARNAAYGFALTDAFIATLDRGD